MLSVANRVDSLKGAVFHDKYRRLVARTKRFQHRKRLYPLDCENTRGNRTVDPEGLLGHLRVVRLRPPVDCLDEI